MFKSLSHIIIAFAALLAIAGQTFAYVNMACEMPADQEQSSHHAMMGHNIDSAADKLSHEEMPCCEEGSLECPCPVSACSNMAQVSSHVNQLLPASKQKLAFATNSAQPHNSYSPLVRPPIFA